MHPYADLSAYLDGALGPEARARVDAHLDTCAVCRTRLVELRSTARLISALPMPVPSRSLVPRVSVPIWLAPLRTLSTIASGAALFLFIASALISSIGVSSQGAAPAAAPAPNATALTDQTRGGAGGGATASNAERSTAQNSSPSPTPAAFGPAFSGGASAPPTASASDAAKFATSPSFSVSRQDTSTQAASHDEAPRPQVGFSPWVWLGLAIGFGALATILGRRLRAP